MKQPVNTHCPWSGEPVSENALTRYRGQTVGFCRAGCRDKFETAINAFDRSISAERSSSSHQPVQPMGEPYIKRRFRSFGVTSLGEARLKTYLIDRAEAPLDPEAAHDALRRYTERCPLAGTDPAPTYGHAIVHRGDEANWLLLHGWRPGGILQGFTARSDPGTLAFEPTDPPLLACVWEQIVMEHERRAWIRHIMTATPNVSNFLKDVLADGDY